MSQLSFNFESLKGHELFRDLKPHIVAAFFKFHDENPLVFTLFEKYAMQLLNSGRQFYGIGAIAERVRWHINLETTDADFKLNNNHRSCYARLLMIKRPEFKSFF